MGRLLTRRVRRARAALALMAMAPAAILLAGCVDLAPRYHRPAPPTPSTFPTGASYGAPAGQPGPAVGWRDFFADPRLKAVIERALANNRDLRLAVANIAAARAQYHVERAALLPTLGAQASANYAGSSRNAAGGASATRYYSLTGDVSAYQLDLFGKVRDLSRAAQDQYFATRAARDAAQITLVSQVAANYFVLGSDEDLLNIARGTLASGADSLMVTQRRFDVGVDSQLAVSQAQTLVQQARFDVARLTTQVAQDRNALDLVVGAPVGDDLLPSGIDDRVVALERLPEAVSSGVLLQRPDVLEAEDQLRAANANIGAARATFFPSISLTGSGGLASQALSTLFRGAAGVWTFAPTVSQTLFDGGANRGNLALAKAQRDAGVAKYEKAIQIAFREVADALAQRGTIDEQLAAQRALTDAAADGLRLSSARYRRGADSYLNVLIAQRTLYGAQQTLVATRRAEAENLVTLYTTLGGGLDGPALRTR